MVFLIFVCVCVLFVCLFCWLVSFLFGCLLKIDLFLFVFYLVGMGFFKGCNFFLLSSMTAIEIHLFKINTDLVPEKVDCCLDKFKRVKLLMRDLLATRQVSKLRAHSKVVLKCPVPLVCREKLGFGAYLG